MKKTIFLLYGIVAYLIFFGNLLLCSWFRQHVACSKTH